ncbi:DDE superfamily endonuclease [Gillisia sp. Hel_I_86]|uniref:transposase n=1 Tax=Gillisia sp. Hel_I_86 TaxID=1249981 RepID=UPI00119AD196|nr:transposase [Gillisia sp. Hel_I_86]TVZ26438.1 DDE superfamily endonuclease [Gillisia sp. Hel_I_86]
MYFQDEARFGMMTHTGKHLTACGIKPIVKYQHIFKTTYLYGSYFPINGNSFVWEIDGVDTTVFEAYLENFSKYKPQEFKIVIIDNAGFHSTKNINVPENIYLLRIPPYTPELNPCEQVWQYKAIEPVENMFNRLNENIIKTLRVHKIFDLFGFNRDVAH